MSCEGDTAHELRETGRRFTVQRLKVAAALRHCGGHRTAEEIRDLLAAEDPHAAMPLSTVYRTLATLKEARLVAEVDAGGRAAYEWVATRPHHHLICQRCGADVGLEPALLTSLSDEIRSATGFEAHLDQHAIYGACAGCSATGSTMDGGEA
ncbi:MAG: Fur family transcriptional regulator [Dehalococcoidia bacterium]